MADYLARGGKAERDTRAAINAHIVPAFGERRVADLTHKTLSAWLNKLATAPGRLRTGGKAQKANVREATDGDARRARRSTANRVLTVLKAALNHAYKEGRVSSDDAWRRVKPFKNVEAPRIRYLSDEEAMRLVNACPTDFRRLVVGALLTGCRYGELTGLRVNDLDPAAGLLHIRESKCGKPRHVHLTDESQRHFTRLAVGKPGPALLLTRDDGGAWGDSHQHRPLQAACETAKIVPAINFHVFRHTFASRLAMKGVPMTVVAAALGNTEAICAKHYAHLSPSYVRDTIREAAGDMGFADSEANVKSPVHKTAA